MSATRNIISTDMRKKRKFITSILWVIIFIIATSYVFGVAKMKLIYGLVGRRLTAYFERKYGARLIVGNVSGNLLSNLYLENIQIEKVKGLPPGLQVSIKSARFNYSPLDLIRRNPRVELQGLCLGYKTFELPIEFTQRRRLIILSFDKRVLDFNSIEGLFSADGGINLYGLGRLRGDILLENLRPKFFNLRIESDELEIFYGNEFRVKAALRLHLQGDADIQYLAGPAWIKEARYSGGFNRMEYKGVSLFSPMDRLLLEMDIKGEDIQIVNKSLDAMLKVDLQLRKEAGDKPYLLGEIETVKGFYNIYQNKFSIRKAKVFFGRGYGREAEIDIAGETRIRRYQIFAAVGGTINNSRLEITSRPSLPHADIMALLLFGKRIEGLSLTEKNELSGFGDMSGSFVSKFFLGKAEAKFARFIGVDELNLGVGLASPSQGTGGPSVEVGKYLGNDKLYGTYKLKPGQDIGQKSTQTMGGEYSVTDNIAVKGERSFNESLNLPQEDRVSVEFRWRF